MKNYLRQNRIPLITLFILSVLSISLVMEEEPYASGDAIEYSLMTEAFYNHLSPDVNASDCESFKAAYIKTDSWESNSKYVAYNETQEFIASSNHKKLDNGNAFFVDKDGKKYSCHFFFYSLVNLPMRCMAALFGFNPLKGFYFTNVLLILISCFVFFKYSKFGKTETAAFMLLFFFSTNYWYLCWVHPELFTVCFVTAGLWLFFHDKHFAGIILVSIAALQNQPIALLVIVLCFVVLYQNKFNLKKSIKTCSGSLLILLPSAFYYYHFGITNLISYEWPLSTDNISVNRVFGFFFDINQGMILAFPFILLLYIGLIIRKALRFRSSAVKWDLAIPVVILTMTIIASGIVAWNMGQAIVNRYVTYIGAIVLVHFFILLMQMERKRIRNVIVLISLASQMVVVLYFQSMNHFDWSTSQPKPLSNWILKNYPRLYNPDPTIFIGRYWHGVVAAAIGSPIYYMKEDGTITKLMVHKKYLNNLKNFGISQKQIDSLALTLKYSSDWAYVDVNSKFTPVLSDEQRLLMQMDVIKNNSNWYQAIQQKAKTGGIPVEEVLKRDAAFVLGINIKLNKTKAEKVQDMVNQIKADSAWIKLIENKAKDLNVPVDTVLYRDACWMVETEKKSVNAK